MLPWPEIITTGRSGCCSLMMSSSCSPSSRLPCSQMSRKTRCGRRASIAASASSRIAGRARAVALVLEDAGHELADVGLVVDDQDIGAHARPPLRRSRGSGSPALLARCRHRVAGNHMRARARRARAGCVEQLDAAAMLLHDLADDREAEAGAPLARRHVGLEQPLAVLAREALAVVGDVDHDDRRPRARRRRSIRPSPALLARARPRSLRWRS